MIIWLHICRSVVGSEFFCCKERECQCTEYKGHLIKQSLSCILRKLNLFDQFISVVAILFISLPFLLFLPILSPAMVINFLTHSLHHLNLRFLLLQSHLLPILEPLFCLTILSTRSLKTNHSIFILARKFYALLILSILLSCNSNQLVVLCI